MVVLDYESIDQLLQFRSSRQLCISHAISADVTHVLWQKRIKGKTYDNEEQYNKESDFENTEIRFETS